MPHSIPQLSTPRTLAALMGTWGRGRVSVNQVHGRCRGGAGEVHGRCLGDAWEMHAGWAQRVACVHGRHGLVVTAWAPLWLLQPPVQGPQPPP